MVQGGVIVRCSTKYSKTAVILVCSLTLHVALLAGSFSIWTVAFHALSPLRVDTEPESVLKRDEAARVFQNDMKRVMGLHDIMVLGVSTRGPLRRGPRQYCR